MGRLKNPTLSTLSPTERAFWEGLRHAQAIGPDDYTFKVKGGRKSKRANRFTSHEPVMHQPDTPIGQLALNAAQWLVEHHPKAVREQGRDTFLAARVQEILKHDFPPQYWDPCPLAEETTRISYPECSTSVIQPPTHLATPGSMNTRCTYDTSTPDAGPAGFSGSTGDDGYFRDNWLREKQFLFTVPAPLWAAGVRPLFSKHTATWQVNHKYRNAQPWCTLYKASTANTAAGLTDRAQSVDKIGRYFYWQYERPQPAPGGSTMSMTRSFVVDARYLGHDYASNPNAASVCLIQIAPATARGRFRYQNPYIHTTMINDCALYAAKPESDHNPICSPYPPTVYSWSYPTNPCGTSGIFGGPGSPCYSIWYCNLPARANHLGVKLPAGHPFHYVDVVPLRGIPGNQANGKYITLPVIDIGRNLAPPAPKPTDPKIQVICHGTTGIIEESGGFLFCSINDSGPCVGSYDGWGYRAYDGCAKLWRVHVFPGQRPTALAFNAAWTAGKYPL